MVAVKLEDADLFGETTCARIEESSVDVSKVRIIQLRKLYVSIR